MVALSVESEQLLDQLDALIGQGATYAAVSAKIDQLAAHGATLLDAAERDHIHGHVTRYRLTVAMAYDRPMDECEQALDANLATLQADEHLWLRASAITAVCGTHPALAAARLPPLIQELEQHDTSQPPLSNVLKAAYRQRDELLDSE